MENFADIENIRGFNEREEAKRRHAFERKERIAQSKEIREKIQQKITELYRVYINTGSVSSIDDDIRKSVEKIKVDHKLPAEYDIDYTDIEREALEDILLCEQKIGSIIPKNALDIYKRLAQEQVVREMLKKDPMEDDDYWEHPRLRLQEFPLFVDMWSRELNTIAEKILDDSRIVGSAKQIDPWEFLDKEYE